MGIEPTTSGLDLPLLLPTELRGRTEKVGDDLGGESRRSTLIYTPELILCSTICVHSATRHNILMKMTLICMKMKLHAELIFI